MSVVVPLSKPVLSPVIIKLDDGKAIETVVSGIRGEFPYSIVVDYDSISYYLFAWRAYSDLIIVGHGSPQLDNKNKVLSIINKVPARRVYLAMCYSDGIAKLVGNNVYGFKGAVDAKVSWEAITASMYYHRGNYQKMMKISVQLLNDLDLVTNPKQPLSQLEIAIKMTTLSILTIGSALIILNFLSDPPRGFDFNGLFGAIASFFINFVLDYFLGKLASWLGAIWDIIRGAVSTALSSLLGAYFMTGSFSLSAIVSNIKTGLKAALAGAINFLTGYLLTTNTRLEGSWEGAFYNFIVIVLEIAYRWLRQPEYVIKEIAQLIFSSLATLSTLNALRKAFNEMIKEMELDSGIASWVISSIIGSVLYGIAKLIVDTINSKVGLDSKYMRASIDISISWWFGIPVGVSVDLPITFDRIL